MTEAVEFGLSEIAENHLPDWISGYACIAVGSPDYKCLEGYKRTVYQPKAGFGSHGCCADCFVFFVKCEQELKGYLSVNTSPEGAAVMAGCVACGATPVVAYELEAGTYTVTLTKKGYYSAIGMMTIIGGHTTDMGTITLTPAAPPTTKAVTFTSVPPGASVRVTAV